MPRISAKAHVIMLKKKEKKNYDGTTEYCTVTEQPDLCAFLKKMEERQQRLEMSLRGGSTACGYGIRILRILFECEALIKKTVPRVTVWSIMRLRRVMLNCDPKCGFVDQYLTLIKGSFSCTATCMFADT